MTNQEIFDRVAVHLMKQGLPSTDGSSCLYRSPNGLACAAGAIISDEFYDSSLEHQGVHDAVVMSALENSIGTPVAGETQGLLEDLQACHDHAYHDRFRPSVDLMDDEENLVPAKVRSFWRTRLAVIADEYSLNTEAMLTAFSENQ